MNEIGYCKSGNSAKGCKLCIEGKKLVLFITGVCGQKCFYCPISEKKFGKDEVYANEWKIEKIEDLYEEIRLTNAKGVGITGGDPLAKIDRCVEYITNLKKKYGKRFHIHLYTIFMHSSHDNLKKLYDAGLDEIRFHPDVNNQANWNKISTALEFDWDVGIEIPCLPDKEKETKELIDYFSSKVKFINLNELEFSDTEIKHYNMSQYRIRNDSSYGVLGSIELGKKLVSYAKEKKYKATVYLCSAKLKDQTQMGNRIKRRANKTAKIFDEITEEGMLIRGVIYLTGFKTGSGYRQKLENINKDDKIKIISDLNNAIIKIKKTCDEAEMEVDSDKLRIITYGGYVEHFAEEIKKLGYVPAIVEEYPTKDAVEIEVEFL